MRIFALISNGVVTELFPTIPTPSELLEILPEDGDIRQMFHPDIHWEEVTEISPPPAAGWLFADGIFSEPGSRWEVA